MALSFAKHRCARGIIADMPSTAIHRFAYHADEQRLDVQFVGGKRYSYFDVPADIAEGLATAPSKGRYFNSMIRDRYRFARQGRITPP
ncbi:KTSC domain-containing protein [Sphingobium cloacae]|nr:KTSC domain-containing protein [Sphingobium cloacae]